MSICKFCGVDLPDHASFCGSCGKLSATSGKIASSAADLYTIPDAGTFISQPSHPSGQSNAEQDRPTFISNATLPEQLASGEDQPTFIIRGSEPDGRKKEEEEEKRRRAALLGLALPLVGEAIATDAPEQHAPMVQGTPNISGAPMLPGRPYLQSQLSDVPRPNYATQSPANWQQTVPTAQPPLVLPQSFPSTPPSYPTAHPPSSYPTAHPPSSGPKPHPQPGCNIWLLMLIVPLIIFASIFGIGLTLFTPDIAIIVNGTQGANVVQGGQFNLSGSNFIPGTTVTLKLDNAPLSVFNQHSIAPVTQNTHPSAQSWLLGSQLSLVSVTRNTITANSDGKFNITIHVGLDWRPGTHTLQASESLSPRIATRTITVYQPGSLPSPTATTTTTATTTATSSASMLSSVTPNIVNLGPVGEGNTQPVSTQITLNTRGSAQLNWSASWDQQTGSWLQLNRTSGQVQAPNAQQLTISAQAGALSAGSYSTTILFTSTTSPQTIGLSVSLTVQPSCIAVKPNTLSFTGIQHISDPQTQTVAITNCGQQFGSWSASTTASWLSVSPSTGSLNSGDTQDVAVTASNLNAQLAPGTYQGTLQFVEGSRQVSVQVTLTVQAPPQLSASPSTIYANRQCSSSYTTQGELVYTCTEALTRSSPPSASINWTASSTGVSGITFTDANGNAFNSGTLASGQTTDVVIHVPADCQTPTTITFNGPGNTVNVPWSCTPLIS